MDVKSVFDNTRYGVLATTNSDGSPWAVPLHVLLEDSTIYWLSDEDTQHSQNILRGSGASLTTWFVPEGEPAKGVYINGSARQLDGSEVQGVWQRMMDKLGTAPTVHDNTKAYQLDIGSINSSKSGKNRWYFYI